MRIMLDTVDNAPYFKMYDDFFSNPKYSKLDVLAKTIYGVLKSRAELSKKNRWSNEKGEVFIYMKLDELGAYLGVQKGTVSKKLSLLESVGLLDREPCPGTRSHKLYLHQVEPVEDESKISADDDHQNGTHIYSSKQQTATGREEGMRSVSGEKHGDSSEKDEVSSEKDEVSLEQEEVSQMKDEVSEGKTIYNNKIQERDNKSNNNNNSTVCSHDSHDVDVENFSNTSKEPLESVRRFFRSIGVAAHMAEKLLVKYTVERLQEVIRLLKMQTDVRNSAGFIVSALRFNYQLPSYAKPDSDAQEVSSADKTDAPETQCQYVPEERPAMNTDSPLIIEGIKNTIEDLYRRRGSIFKLYEDWLTNHGLVLENGKVVAMT